MKMSGFIHKNYLQCVELLAPSKELASNSLRGGQFTLTISIFFLTIFSAFAQAQTNFLNLEKQLTLEVKAKSATTDQFGNIYIISPKNEIVKYDSEGNELFRYSNSRLGGISYFDAGNPFNLLLFYKSFNTVKILDRTLTETGVFHLFDMGLFNANCMSVSDDKHLWIFDKDNHQLKKFHFSGRLVVASQQLNQLLQKNLSPSMIKEIGNRVYLYDGASGIYVFDVLGKFLHFYPYQGIENFKVLSDKLFLFKNNELTLVNLSFNGSNDVSYLFPKKIMEVGKRFFSNNQLLHVREEGVDIYQIQ